MRTEFAYYTEITNRIIIQKENAKLVNQAKCDLEKIVNNVAKERPLISKIKGYDFFLLVPSNKRSS